MNSDRTHDSPPPGNPVVPETFDGNKEIQFRCRSGIACWNACCSNIDISLTPYDILRLKRRFGMGSGEFLKKYTAPYELEPGGIAGVKLRPVENGTACQFMAAEGCTVYQDRPTACRYYPVALLSLRRQGETTDTQSYALVKEEHCLGHNEQRTVTINRYRQEQGVEEYDELARGWRQLILKKKSSGPSIGKPTRRSLELFFMACYDLDRFTSFVASEGFSELYDVPADEMQQILRNDTETMLFGFRFLKQVLFGEQTIPLKKEVAEERQQRLREKRLQAESDAAGKLAAEQDDMYDDRAD